MNILSNALHNAMQTPLLVSDRPSQKNHPSAASIEVPFDKFGTNILGACNREQWYRRKGYTPSESRNLNWEIAAQQGDALHNMMVELLDEYGLSMGLQRMSVEGSLYEPFIRLSGRVDYIAYDHNKDEVIGIEFKSVGDWKSKKCLEMPDYSHVMQSMLYLDHYQQAVPDTQIRPSKWYIWYIARGENWELKGRKQLSPFVQLWDFYITIDRPDSSREGTPVIHTPTGIKRVPEITIGGMWNRYAALNRADDDNIMPDRDFEIQYSEEKLAGLYKLGLIEYKKDKEPISKWLFILLIFYKKDKEPISKWLDKGAPKGELAVQMGDAACKFCSYSRICWGQEEHSFDKKRTYNFPKKKESAKNKDEVVDFL